MQFYVEKLYSIVLLLDKAPSTTTELVCQQLTEPLTDALGYLTPDEIQVPVHTKYLFLVSYEYNVTNYS